MSIQIIKPSELPVKVSVDGTEYIIFYNEVTQKLERFLASYLIPDLTDFVTLSTAQTITGSKTFTNTTVFDSNGTTTGLREAILTVKKAPEETITNYASYVQAERVSLTPTTGNNIAAGFRSVSNTSVNTGTVTGSVSQGVYDGSGGNAGVYGAIIQSDFNGSGTGTFVTGAFTRAKIEGTSTGDTDYIRGNSVEARLDNPNVDVDFVQGEHVTVDLRAGTVNNDTSVYYADFDITGSPTITGNLTYYRGGDDLSSVTVGGKKRFIWNESGLESDFNGLINVSNSNAEIDAATDDVLVPKKWVNSNFVDTTSNQDIGGQKRFTASTVMNGNLTFISPNADKVTFIKTGYNIYTFRQFDGDGLQFYNSTQSKTPLYLSGSNSFVGINKTNPNKQLDVDGDIGGDFFKTTKSVSEIDAETGDTLPSKDWIVSNTATQTNGDFIPTLVDAGGGATYTVTTTTAKYVKTGNTVYFSIKFDTINTTGTPSGNVNINGLPFDQDFSNIYGVSIQGGNVDFSSISARNFGTTTIRLEISDTDSSTLNRTGYDSVTFTNGVLEISGTYITGF